VVVGEGDRVEVPGQHWQHRRLGAERPRFLDSLTAGGHHAFEVADRRVRRSQQRGELAEWIAPAGDHLAGKVRQHDVASEDQIHPSGSRFVERLRDRLDGTECSEGDDESQGGAKSIDGNGCHGQGLAESGWNVKALHHPDVDTAFSAPAPGGAARPHSTNRLQSIITTART